MPSARRLRELGATTEQVEAPAHVEMQVRATTETDTDTDPAEG